MIRRLQIWQSRLVYNCNVSRARLLRNDLLVFIRAKRKKFVFYIQPLFFILGVVRELIVSGSGEEDMSALLCGMHAAPNDALLLKLHILKALLACLRDSHRTRTIFRKVNSILLLLVQSANCYTNGYRYRECCIDANTN